MEEQQGEAPSTATAAQKAAAQGLFDKDRELGADEVYLLLKEFFQAADKDGSGCLDRQELVEVISLFYKQEQVTRKKEIVQKEVDEAVTRFDANGDGVLQFYEFVDMFALSDSFRFAIPISVRLDVRSRMMEERGLQMRQELMEEREQMLDDATHKEKEKVEKMNKLVDELTSRLDEKVLRVRELEGDLHDSQEQLRATEARLKEALLEAERLHHVSLQNVQENTLTSPYGRSRAGSNSNANSFSPRVSVSPRSSLRSPQSARSNASQSLGDVTDGLGTLDELHELSPPPRTPRQGEIRRKRQS